MKGRRKSIVAVITISLLLVWLLYPGPAGPFDTGPQVAGGVELQVVPPPLRIPSAECFDDEEDRVLLSYRGGDGDFRFGFDPDDSGERILALDACPERSPDRILRIRRNKSLAGRVMRWLGVGDDASVSPAVVICAGADEVWTDGLGEDIARFAARYSSRLYLAGTLSNGKLGSVPFAVHQGLESFRWFESNVFGLWLRGQRKMGGRGVSTVQVFRQANGLRVRWGAYPHEDATDWVVGDEMVPDEALRGRQSGPILPALAAYLKSKRFPAGAGGHGVAALVVGARTRYLDLLRVVECAGGDPRVVFGSEWKHESVDPKVRHLPIITEPDARSAEDCWQSEVERGQLSFFQVTGSGKLISPSLEYDLDDVTRFLDRTIEKSRRFVLIFPDRQLEWRRIHAVITGIQDRGLIPLIRFAVEDPVLRNFRDLPLPAPGEGAMLVDISLGDPLPVTETIAGQDLRISVPENALLEDVARQLLDLARRGAAGFRFP